jgi:biopolymer transport protein ExbD
MRLRSLQPPSPAGKINVTPLIDVVMVLIIFYLMVGKLASDQSRVQLPIAAGTQAQADKGLVLNLALDESTGEARLTMEGAELPLEELATTLRGRLPELERGVQQTPVSLRADKRLAYATVAPVVAACRDAGLVSLRLVTVAQDQGVVPAAGSAGVEGSR